MAYAVTHILTPMIIVDFYRQYRSKWKFSKNFVLFAGIAGILPDIDIPLGWILSTLTGNSIGFHRTYTHAVVWPLLFALIATVIIFSNKQKYFNKFSKREMYLFFIMIATGWFAHLVLDCGLAGNDMLAWFPVIATAGFCPSWTNTDMLAGIDAVFLIVWLTHEQIKKKIKSYV